MNASLKKDPRAEAVRQEIYRMMSPSQKWAEAVRLRELAWQIKEASLREQYPEWTEEQIDQIVKRIFLYANT